jgi:hypothetical protein
MLVCLGAVKQKTRLYSKNVANADLPSTVVKSVKQMTGKYMGHTSSKYLFSLNY